MSRHGLWTSCTLMLAHLLTAPLGAQAPQQFRANISMSGGSLSSPATGIMYFGGAKMRMEVTAEGQQMTIISDPASGSMLIMMPSERMYMEMPAGMGPVSAPRVRSMDPANPCSGGQATGCMSLGEETVNGYASRKWQYQMDGETETAWISTQHRFPVRLVGGDGTTTDFSDVAPGAQPAALFSPPSGYTKMEMGPMSVMGMGRGGMPPSAMAGIPPDALAGMDSATIAMIMGGGGAAMMGRGGAIPGAMTLPPGSTEVGEVWSQGDGWIFDVTITVAGTDSGTNGVRGGTNQSSFSGEYKLSVPLTYGTPGAGATGAAIGPAWQLVATLGSPKALATPLTFSATTQYRGEGSWPAGCPIEDAGRFTTTSRGTAQISTADHSNMLIMGAQVRWQLSPDLRTHQIMVAAGGPVTESTETVTTQLNTCGNGQPTTETQRATGEVGFGSSIDFGELPLPATPSRMSGTRTEPMRVQIGGFTGMASATYQWTLRPM